MTDLQSLVSNLERKNDDMRSSSEGLRHSVEEKLLSPRSPRQSSPSPSRYVQIKPHGIFHRKKGVNENNQNEPYWINDNMLFSKLPQFFKFL